MFKQIPASLCFNLSPYMINIIAIRKGQETERVCAEINNQTIKPNHIEYKSLCIECYMFTIQQNIRNIFSIGSL